MYLATKAEERAWRWKCWKANQSEFNSSDQRRPWVKAILTLFGFRNIAWRIFDLEMAIGGYFYWRKAASSGRYIHDNRFDPLKPGEIGVIQPYGTLSIEFVGLVASDGKSR